MKTLSGHLRQLLLVFLLIVPVTLKADQSPTRTTEVAIAISTGGARGLAAVGVLQAFEEKNITVKAITGTSIGAIVGGLYACGYDALYLRSLIDSLDFNELFATGPQRTSMFLTRRSDRERHLVALKLRGFKPQIPTALSSAQALTTLLTVLTTEPSFHANNDFTRLPIPFGTVVTDIVSGEPVVITSGSLADALRASMAFPLAFTGVERDGAVLMDGGMTMPIPVELANSMVNRTIPVVAIDCHSPLVKKEKLNSPFEIANQVTTIMVEDQLSEQLNKADIVITPELDDFTSADFDLKDSIVERGYRAGLAAADSILAKYPPDVSNVKPKIVHPPVDVIVARIDVSGNRRSRDWLIRSYFPIERFKPFSISALEEGLEDAYGTDWFEKISATLSPLDTSAVLHISVAEKPYTQLRLGWHWDDSYRSEEFVELLDDNVLGVGLQTLAHVRFGESRRAYFGSMKIDRIFDTYLTARARLFHSHLKRPTFNPDLTPAEIRKELRWGLAFFMGQQFARIGTLTGGIFFEEVEFSYESTQPDRTFGLRRLQLQSLFETLDSKPFARSGRVMLLELETAGKVLGGDEEFTRFHGLAETYVTIANHVTLHPRIQLGISRKDLPVSEKFYMGGIPSFGGLRLYQLSGDKLILLNTELRGNLPLNLYLTGRLDVGDVYRSTDQIKFRNLRYGGYVALSYGSPLGPIELGYGFTENNVDRVYFQAGFDF